MWKLAAEYREGDEVERTYNGETGHIMQIMPGRGNGTTRYKITSPSNPRGFTYEWADWIKPSTGLPKAPPNNVIQMPPPPDPSQQQQQPVPPPPDGQYPPLQAVPSSWKLAWNPLNKEDEIQWERPYSDRDFANFVRSVMKAVGVEPWMSNNQGGYVDTPDVQKYHDLILQITKGQVPSYDDEREGILWVARQLPIMLQNLIPNQDARQDMVQQHAEQFYNGITPNSPSLQAQYPRWTFVHADKKHKKKKCHYCNRDAHEFYVYHVGVCHEHNPPPSTPPADVTPTPTTTTASGESFQDAAAEQIPQYEALARDIIKTLPPDQWPQWVKNQAQRMLHDPTPPVDMTPYPHKDALDTLPTQTTFPEDWNF